jgi:hypothetical protein
MPVSLMNETICHDLMLDEKTILLSFDSPLHIAFGIAVQLPFVCFPVDATSGMGGSPPGDLAPCRRAEVLSRMSGSAHFAIGARRHR